MAFNIAVAGKGGTGKTTICALLVKILADEGLKPILAIDADPNSNLGEVLGLEGKVNVGEIVDEIAKNPGLVPTGMAKREFIELEVSKALQESAGFDLLSLGRPEGSGCYCYVNNILRDIVKKVQSQYAFCVIDNEAGMEHLSRRTMRKADMFIVVSDSTKVGFKAALRIRSLIDELKFEFSKIFLFLNKSQGALPVLNEQLAGFDRTVVLPYDEQVFKKSLNGEDLLSIDKDSLLLSKLINFRREHGSGIS